MSSQILYETSTKTEPAPISLPTSSAPLKRPPRRSAALASQAATQALSKPRLRRESASSSTTKSSGSSQSTLPHTPRGSRTSRAYLFGQPKKEESKQTEQQQSIRPMAALPRSKRLRRGVDSTFDAQFHGMNGVPVSNGSAMYNTAAIPSKSSIIMGIDTALNSGHHEEGGQTAPYGRGTASSRSRGSITGNNSIREVIGGQEREVFVVDSASPERYKAQQHGDADRGRPSLKGKRKAFEPFASPHAPMAGYDYAVNPSSNATASKRRRKDPQEPGISDDAARNLYASNADPAAQRAIYPNPAAQKLPPGAGVASYRGGYPAGNAYYKQKSDAAPYGQTTETVHFPRIPPPIEPIDDSEGHYIVRAGEYFTEKYKIESLLGQGTFGKVVKCRETTKPRCVAIKVIRAVQKYTDAAQIEIRVLKALRDNDPMNENKCIHLIETFTYRNHVCIVSELLGQSVFDFLKDNDYYPFPSRHIWSFAQQLLRSVSFLHRLGLVHTDLKPENILLVSNDWDSFPISNRYNAKRKRVLRNTDIRLIDFGSATFNDEYHSQVVSTRHYRAPEIILQMGWSFPCDAWSIGCILVEFYTGDALFQTHDNLEHLAMMECVLNPMPDDFRRKAETYRPNYFRSGRLDFPNSCTSRDSRKHVKSMRPLESLIKSPSGYAKHDSRFIHLLKRLLHFDPSQRIRVDQALKHPYFELEEHEIPP